MPKKLKGSIEQMPYYVWRLFRERNGVFYADGRFKGDDRGRHSLASRDRVNALIALRELDRLTAEKNQLISTTSLFSQTNPGALSNGVSAATSSFPPLSLEDGRDLYFKSRKRSFVTKGASESSLTRYSPVMTSFIEYVRQIEGLNDWIQVTSNVVQDYAYHRETTPSGQRKRKAMPRTLAFEIGFIQGVIRYFVKRKLVPPENHENIDTRDLKVSSRYSYRTEEVDAMLERCFVTHKQQLEWLGFVILFAARTGMRISELRDLRWSDIDLEAGTIRLIDERANKTRGSASRTLKSGCSRSIKLHVDVRTVLPSIPPGKDGLVLHMQKGSKLDPDKVLKQFRKHVLNALADRFPSPEGEIGFKDGVIHSFRHHFVARCAAMGVSKEYVQKWLGHSDSDMVNYYFAIHEQDASRQMAKLESESTISTSPSSAAWRNAVVEKESAASSKDVGDIKRKESIQSPEPGANSASD